MLSSFETASLSSSKTLRLQGTVLYCGRAIPIFFWLGNICVSFKDKILINSITIMFRQFNPQKMLLKCDGRVCWESIPPCTPQQLVKVNTGNARAVLSAEHSHRGNVEHLGCHVEQIVCSSGPTGRILWIKLVMVIFTKLNETTGTSSWIASRAVLLCSGFFSERVDFQPTFFLFSQHWQNSSVCT